MKPDPYSLTPHLEGVTAPAKDEAGRYLATLETAPMWRRIGAKLLDAIVSGLTTWGFSKVLPLPAASALGVGWFLTCDWSGSPGKWLFRIRAVMVGGGRVSLLASVERNLLLGLPTFGRALINSGLTGASGRWGDLDRWLVSLISVAVVISEIISMWLQDDARRWGDRFGGTRVVTR